MYNFFSFYTQTELRVKNKGTSPAEEMNEMALTNERLSPAEKIDKNEKTVIGGVDPAIYRLNEELSHIDQEVAEINNQELSIMVQLQKKKGNNVFNEILITSLIFLNYKDIFLESKLTNFSICHYYSF